MFDDFLDNFLMSCWQFTKGKGFFLHMEVIYKKFLLNKASSEPAPAESRENVSISIQTFLNAMNAQYLYNHNIAA